MIKKIIITLISLYFISCSSNKEKDIQVTKKSSPESLYISAMENFKEQNYEQAIAKFNQIEQKYPLSNEAVQSQIQKGFISYLNLEYD